MKDYQERYIANLEKVLELSDLSGDIPQDAAAFLQQRTEDMRQISRLSQENTDILRNRLMPLLDDIVSAGEDEISDLDAFAYRLAPGVKQLDLILSYRIRYALVSYARKWKKRDMLIKQLYHTGMTLFYLKSMVDLLGERRYDWKMSMMFGEAASYIKMYDEIEDPEIRGYIHRSMGNLALAYTWNEGEAQAKLIAIRRSMNVLTDPAYRKKTPSLPWDLYLLKSHQERTTAMTLLRRGEGSPELVRKVMESAVYVWERQLSRAKSKGTPLSVHWWLEYEMAQYHCGIYTLPVFLKHLEETYMELDERDFSEEGIFGNVNLPAYYTVYLEKDAELVRKKRDVVQYMYGRILTYAKHMPNGQLNSRLLRTLLAVLNTFLEYPGGLTQKDFLQQIILGRNPELYVFLCLTAWLSRRIAQKAIEECPDSLTGVLSCQDAAEVMRRREEILEFVYESAKLHDVGTLLFLNLVTQSGRSWMEDEKNLYELHVLAGKKILSRCKSTACYAPTAWGHHRDYDGKGGYPPEYDRTKNPDQPVVDIVSAAGALLSLMEEKPRLGRRGLSPAAARETLAREAGHRYSPVFVGLLLSMGNQLDDLLEEERTKAYEQALRLLKGEN